MAELDFPTSGSSPWTDPNGVEWTHDGDGWVRTASGVSVHNDLSNRNAADAHPQSAVTDLVTDLAATVKDSDFVTAGYMKSDGSGTYSVQSSPIPTTETAAKCTDAAADNTAANETSHTGLITSTGVTYANLNTNGDVGTGSTQVAAGDHAHTEYATLDDAVAMAIALG